VASRPPRKKRTERRPAPPIAKKIGRRIRQLRGLLLTQERLAWDLDLPKSHVNRIESGQRLPSIEVLDKIAKRLRVEARDLLVFPERGLVDEAIDAVRQGGPDLAQRVLDLPQVRVKPRPASKAKRP
jgi:transcriptional regulator with XRE-family HTH domain